MSNPEQGDTGQGDTRKSDELDWKSVKSELLEGARKRGAMVARVGDPGLLPDAPVGQRPTDLLPQVRSMIVLGGSSPRVGEWNSPRAEVLETVGTADRMAALGSAIARQIEERLGYYALNVPTATDQDDKAFLDFAAAAVVAGVGSPSLAGPVLHPEYGFLYLTVILTSLPLPFDGPLDEPACPAPSCVEMYDERGVTPCTVQDGLVIGRRYDAERCRDRVYHYWIPGYQKVLERVLSEPDADRRKMMLYGSYFTRTMWSITYSNVSQGQCFECMRVCPVGADKRVLK